MLKGEDQVGREVCFFGGVVLNLAEFFEKGFFVHVQMTQYLFNYKFRNRVYMRLYGDWSVHAGFRPFFMTSSTFGISD